MCVVPVVAGNEHKSSEFCVDEFPMASLAARNISKTGLIQISNQLADFARHNNTMHLAGNSIQRKERQLF